MWWFGSGQSTCRTRSKVCQTLHIAAWWCSVNPDHQHQVYVHATGTFCPAIGLCERGANNRLVWLVTEGISEVPL